MASTALYCICKEPYDASRFMIQCDICKDWFHGSCIGLMEYQSSEIENYHCPDCELQHGPSILKQRRNCHRHDCFEVDADKKPVQTGTVVFIKELKTRTFPSAEEVLLRLYGSQLTADYLEQNGFDKPILVENKDGLGLQVPSPTFTIYDVERLVGPDTILDVIDVNQQREHKMNMKEYCQYFNSPNRTKIYNVISLEFSKTSLSDYVTPPSLIRNLSWVHNVWPEYLPDNCPYSKPEVHKYCLMGVKDSFTDFHIDFGGTSVWYHVLQGEKVFYLIRPSQANLQLYESWMSSSNQSETFFGDQVDMCYRCVVRQGQTLFIPTGWIHAVLTPVDSLVFGGNFLHTFNIALQLQIYELERKVKIPDKYQFPSFQTTNWYAAKYILEQLRDYNDEERKPPVYLLQGAKALIAGLKSWIQRKDFFKQHKGDIPETIQHHKLIKEVAKEIRIAEKTVIPKVRPERKKKKRNAPLSKNLYILDVLHLHTQEKLQQMQQEISASQSDSSQPGVITGGPLKVRIPKAGALLDQSAVSPDKSSGLKLVVSNGKIISGNNQSIATGQFQPLVKSCKSEDSDSDTLVVDENPPTKSAKIKSGPLKLKLSFNKSVINSNDGLKEGNAHELESALPSSGLNGCIDDILKASGYATDGESGLTNVDFSSTGPPASPTTREAIQGMLSIGAVGISLQPQQAFSLTNTSANINISPNSGKNSRPQRQRQRFLFSDDTGENMDKCHQDAEYVYPTLDISDDEIHVFKPRGRVKRDEPWNPKAKLTPNCPKPDRPQREGTKKEAVESGLAAAAAKLATLPPPKRPYYRRKPIQPKTSVLNFSVSDNSLEVDSGPSTSVVYPSNTLKQQGFSLKKSVDNDSPQKIKKPKKGFATAKQRLGKILKIHKMLH